MLEAASAFPQCTARGDRTSGKAGLLQKLSRSDIGDKETGRRTTDVR
jgi:hypothetical protein